MTRTCLSAFTALDPTYPPYINVSAEDGKVVVRIRSAHVMSPPRADGTSFPTTGSEGVIALDEDAFVALAKEALGALGWTTVVCSK